MVHNKKYSNFSEFFEYITANYGSRGVIFWKEDNKYQSITGKKLKELVYLTAKAIERFNLKPGDRAAIISESRFEWVVADFACIVNRLITVPIYTTMTSSQIKYILQHSGSKICFVSTKLLADRINTVFDELPELSRIITFNKLEDKAKHILDFQELIYESIVHNIQSYNEEDADKYFSDCSKKINENDLLTMIYTSGTTGFPKGVCLTHKNVLTNVAQCNMAFKLTASDRLLSFLPLAHSYERATGYYFALSTGAEVYYAKSIDTLQSQLEEVRPTLMTCVPLMFSRVYARIMKNLENLPKRRQLFVKTAFKIGKRYRENKNHFLWRAADKMVFKKIRERTGGKARFFISGGSALNKNICEFFDSIGIKIYEGYGMTEASPVISVNREAKNKIGTVGHPLDGVEVKIADGGEILVRGDTVMQGYYKNDEETKQTVINGWLHTGDIGVIDDDGFLKITDRKKSLIKTEGGEYISLTHIEDTLAESNYIDQAAAFASDERHFVSALIVPDFNELKNYADSNNITVYDEIELVQNPKIIKLIESEIEKVQSRQAKYERVRKFVLLPRAFTIDGGELTPSLKIKRKVIEDKYKDIIDGMYKAK